MRLHTGSAQSNVEQNKYQTCPYDDAEGILLVDAETETIPNTNSDGDLQYYCPNGQHTFAHREDDNDSYSRRRR
jgi:hypothetical protein